MLWMPLVNQKMTTIGGNAHVDLDRGNALEAMIKLFFELG